MHTLPDHRPFFVLSVALTALLFSGCSQTRHDDPNDLVLGARMVVTVNSFAGEPIRQLRIENGPQAYVGKLLILYNVNGTMPQPDEYCRCQVHPDELEDRDGVFYQVHGRATISAN
jgi:hypothetical protein